jgi:dsDNA-binding SOS-regulon protein
MLSSSSLSQRSHFYIDEFLNQLVFPSLDGTMVHPSIAIGKDNSAELKKMWKNYQPLLTDAAIAASEMTFWMIGETYYDHFPKVELLEVLPKDVQSDIIQDGNWKKGTRNNKIIDLANKNGIITQQVNLVIDDKAQELLTLFWENNKRLLAAVINGLETQERKKVSALLNQASKRDTTKYNVYFEGMALNKEPLGKAMTAFCIVKKWVDIQRKNVTLTELNDAFPRKCNPYYERGQWYNHLFYEVADNYFYDGENAEGEVQGNWDFDKKGRFNINLTGGQKVTMLKMWRKDALETLTEWTEKKKLFNGLLNVVPV